MAPGTGLKPPVARTRTGCLTCRKRKVKCDEQKPHCSRCIRLQRVCVWSDELQAHSRQYSESSSFSVDTISPKNLSFTQNVSRLARPPGQNLIFEFPNLDRQTMPYIHHFITFCCRFIAYPNDNEGNPFEQKLVPLASSSPALLHAMTAVAAGHLARSQKQHTLIAAHHYSLALRAMNDTLSDPDVAKSDSALGACLLLCIYEITHSDNCSWLHHLSGARDLIQYRGGPKSNDYLTRFFSLLDVSGSLCSGNNPLIDGNYWIEDELPSAVTEECTLPWPYYDSDNTVILCYHKLMTYMARLSTLSNKSRKNATLSKPEEIAQKVWKLHADLMAWWDTCPPRLKDQTTNWRRLPRPEMLSVTETLEAESCSSCKSCLKGCIIYLHHILDPLSENSSNEEVLEAINWILESAREVPEGFGLEMGLHWGLFMAGIAIFNDVIAENLIRHKMRSDNSISIYHATQALELLEVLWKRQHQYGKKYDWRQLQDQMGIQVYVKFPRFNCLDIGLSPSDLLIPDHKDSYLLEIVLQTRTLDAPCRWASEL